MNRTAQIDPVRMGLIEERILYHLKRYAMGNTDNRWTTPTYLVFLLGNEPGITPSPTLKEVSAALNRLYVQNAIELSPFVVDERLQTSCEALSEAGGITISIRV